MAQDPDHSDGVLFKPFVRITDGSDDSSSEIIHSPHAVDDGKIRDVVEKTVDRNVPAQRILLRGPEALRPDDFSFLVLGFLKFRMAAERGDLDDLSPFEKDVDQTKSSTDHPAVSEEVPDLLRMGIGCNVEVFRSLSQEEITNTASHQIGQETMSAEAIKDLQRLFVNHFSGDRMRLISE